MTKGLKKTIRMKTVFFILAVTWIILRISARISYMSRQSIQYRILRAPHCRSKAATLISHRQITYFSNSFPKAKQWRNEITCVSPWHYLRFMNYYTCINADTCAAHWVTLSVDKPALNLSSKTVSSFDIFTDSINFVLSCKVSASQIRVPNATKPRNSASESDKRGNIMDDASTARIRLSASCDLLKATARFRRRVERATCKRESIC